MEKQALALGAELRPGVVHQIVSMGDSFALSLGADFVQAKRIILCTGAKQPKMLPGEGELLTVTDEQPGELAGDVVAGRVRYPEDGTMLIETLEGVMCATPGDWIIRGVKGELYPCKPDIFAATYEPAGGDDASREGTP